ncbi:MULTISPECIES: hormogonium polysaccharide biosynthesis glycosyltransferase HpsE [unclassified Anabaena]|uniref:hormogonium polysaccharide biosynthesis glycosyltransferase HpsE n=1 Tax=unclassified Anabaena TaxID=2619674 RepID=UPI001446528F|nr:MULTISPECIES: hormogonium polysaccharide biosynthesis glycosyltransferase HpsE [unclassified Anabaena]MTJ06622.1 glycosyltransferase family 2 protein [Anabaena sp. UHCC 0204]MTJ54394.1 glycosyltransferase family 2 protein [Anabaena sp. UHCC 0253]
MNDKNHILDITVAIPTYNGEKRLPLVLDLLLNQTGLENVKWEIIVIDNNSSDQTSEVVAKYIKTANSNNIDLRYFLEPQQGAAFARLRAVNEATGNIIAFLDDDNLPDVDWLAAAYKFGIDYPQAGAWSGQIHGAFEVSPPENFKRIQAFLAIREHGNKPYIFDGDNLRLPPAAALVIRKQVWCENVPKKPILSGKLPGILVQGDDYEPLLYIHKAGWEIWYNPTMHTYHQIPQWRLEKNYLLNIARGCGLPTFQLVLINTKKWQIPKVFVYTVLGSLRRLLRHIIKYRGKINSDLIIMFEMEFYKASMLSPFYSCQLYMKRFYR